jgi:hypothetical protein
MKTIDIIARCSLVGTLCGCIGQIGGDENEAADALCKASQAATSETRRLSARQYENAIRDAFDGLVNPSPSYPGAAGTSASGFSTEPGLYYPSEQNVEEMMIAAEDVAEAVSSALPQLLPCATEASPGDACANVFIDTYARRAFRRTVDEGARAVLMDAFHAGAADGGDFTASMALLVAQMLQMAEFLYVAEDAAPSRRALTGTELATRLAFALWDSIPDDEALDAAESGKLDSREGIAAEARRMLASPKADATIARFFREWTGTKDLSVADKLTDAFPTFTAELASSMNESFDRFAVDAFRSGATLENILRTEDAWIDAGMAAFFGLPAPASGSWEKVSLDPGRSAGIMTQPAMMASLAHSSDTSYVYRGRFLRKRLLCEVLGTPPADAQAQFSAIELPADPTAKDKSAAVQARSPCGSCHSLIDPGGLAFEKFDAIGNYRDSYASGKTIDPSGTLVDVDGETVAFGDPAELMAELADLPAVRECFVRQVYRFAMSRMDDETDACAIASAADAFDASGGGLADALAVMVQSDAFRFRRDP